MSTHWTAGVIDNDGNVTACYVNFDGSPRTAWRAMRGLAERSGCFEAVLSKIERAQRGGGIRRIESNGELETYGGYRGEKSKGNEWVHNSRQEWLGTTLLIREDMSVVSGYSL